MSPSAEVGASTILPVREDVAEQVDHLLEQSHTPSSASRSSSQVPRTGTHPFFRKSAPARWKSPRIVNPRHLTKSSSTPPAVVTSASTSLCLARNRIISRKPEEIRLEVYPRNRVSGCSLFSRCLRCGQLRHSPAKTRPGLLRLQRTISSTTSIARASPVAWNPIVS